MSKESGYKTVAENIRWIMAQEVPKKMMIEDINEYLDQLTGVIIIEGSAETNKQLCEKQ